MLALLFLLSLVVCSFFSLFLSELYSIMLEIPLFEWSGINLNDCVLNEGLGSDHFVICGVVNDIHDSCFSSALLRSPVVVTTVKSEGSVLVVCASSPHSSDFFGT